MNVEQHTIVVVGDVGSTKGAWSGILHDGSHKHLLTDGYNPHAQRDEVLTSTLKRLAESYGHIELLVYYGTGISDEVVARSIADQINEVLDVKEVNVHSDLLGAARACLGNLPGIVAILGTGSNACIYDGTEVSTITPSLGYPLGDEGSGWRIGSIMIKEYFYGNMPSDLRSPFRDILPDTRRELLRYLKHSPQPNRYLASFATFAGEHKMHPWISETVRNCLDAFVVSHILPLTSDGPIYFAGSIAGIFNDILDELLNEYGLSIGGIIANPLEALLKYHTDL